MTRPGAVAVLLLCAAGGATAWAAPTMLPLGEADQFGRTNYSVRCDDGAKHIVQCTRDDQHCGYAGDSGLAAEAARVCSARAAPASPQAPDDAPMQTAPVPADPVQNGLPQARPLPP